MLDQVGTVSFAPTPLMFAPLEASPSLSLNQHQSLTPLTDPHPKGKKPQDLSSNPKLHPKKRTDPVVTGDDLDVRFDICWEDTVPSKQTLFPVYSLLMEPPIPQRGVPPEGVSYTLRSTKRVNMHPYPTLTITHKRDGTLWRRDEEIKVSLVEKHRGSPSSHSSEQNLLGKAERIQTQSPEEEEGGCPCNSQGIICESQEYQIRKDGITRVENGRICFKKLQIGCVTSVRGHGVPFQIKIEFIRPRSPLYGQVIYSLPIEVGAKSPFALVYMKAKSNSQSLSRTLAPSGIWRPWNLGEERMRSIVTRYGLQHFLEVFLKQEVDAIAFECLTEESLTEMGITGLCDQFFILQAVRHYLASNMVVQASSSQ